MRWCCAKVAITDCLHKAQLQWHGLSPLAAALHARESDLHPRLRCAHSNTCGWPFRAMQAQTTGSVLRSQGGQLGKLRAQARRRAVLAHKRSHWSSSRFSIRLSVNSVLLQTDCAQLILPAPSLILQGLR